MRRIAALLAGLVLLALAAMFLLSTETQEPAEPADAHVASPASGDPEPLRLPTSPEPALAPTLPTAEPEPADVAPMLAPVPHAATIVGRVVDEAQAPRAGIELLVAPKSLLEAGLLAGRGSPQRFASDMCRSLPDGSFELTVTAASELQLMLSAPGGGWDVGLRLAALPGVRIDVGDVVLRGERVVTGRVQDPAGRPIAGAAVVCTDAMSFLYAFFERADTPLVVELQEHVFPDDEWIAAWLGSLRQSGQARTAADGSFRVTLASASSDDFLVCARAPGFTIGVITPDDFEESGATSVTLTLRPAAARIAGRVRSLDGAPPPAGTVVSARVLAGAAPEGYGRAVQVAPDGRFEIAGLLDVLHELQAIAPDRTTEESVIVAAGRLDAELVLGPPLAVIVRVPHEGKLLDHFKVRVHREGGWSAGAEDEWEQYATDPRAPGSVLVPMPWPFEATLQSFAGGACSEPTRVDLSETLRSRVMGLPLVASRRVSGVVVDRDSQPLADATVEVRRGNKPLHEARTVTGADGVFDLGPFPGARLLLHVQAPGYTGTALEVPDGTPAPIVVTLDAATLVQLRRGPLIAEALRRGAWKDPQAETVHVRGLDNTTVSLLRALGHESAFLDNLPPGRYRVDVAIDRERVRGPEFTAVAGALVVVDV